MFPQFTPGQLIETVDFDAGCLLLVDKPLGWTSFDVVNKLRYRLRNHTGNRKIKVGHAGTLDPKATGLMLVCTGKQTKNIDLLMGMDKTYTGTIRLGHTTPSYDLETGPNAFYRTAHITPELVHQTLPHFMGALMQVPPLYSAIKVDGQRSYIAARKGHDKVLEARPVVITDFKVETELLPAALNFEVSCSKGTYIRSLAHDFAKAVQSGGCLAALRRTAIGPFDIADAWNIEDLAAILEKDWSNK
jgi:tRNA pseudouridine55 synthase